MTRERILFCWSGGKDSALALHEVLRSGRYDVAALLTTVSDEHDRICMHGVRKSLLDDQVAALGLRLHEVRLPASPTNDQYEAKMAEALAGYRSEGIRQVAFGDIFLEDLKAYREKNLARMDFTGLFPIWKRDTRELISTFVGLGFKAVLTCVDTQVLPATFAGRAIDDTFAAALPVNVDPCGENGEFHSFVHAGPIFSRPVPFTLGETHDTGRFFFRDLVPATPALAGAQ